jgi:hypothetical protein
MFIPDLGSDFFPSRIPDLNRFHPGSRFRIKEFKYFNPKIWFLSSRKYDTGCSSQIPDADPDFLLIPDPGSRGQKAPDPGSGSATLDGSQQKSFFPKTFLDYFLKVPYIYISLQKIKSQK